MKGIIKKVAVLTATVAMSVGFAFAPIKAVAESSVENHEITSEERSDTFDDFLAWTEEEAEKYGYGDEYGVAIEAIKTAATQKQVTISTIASAILAAAVLAFIIVQKVKDIKYKRSVTGLSKSVEDLVMGTNSLIDETNANGKTGTETKAKTAKIEKEEKKIERALALFISAFLRFTDGVKLGDNKKQEVQTSCLAALREIGERGDGNEDNEK